MIRFTRLAVIAAIFAGFTFAQTEAFAQNKSTRIGLVDMAKVFENYQRFKDEREALKDELKKRETEIKALAEQIKAAGEELKNSPYGKDSPQYAAQEKKVIELNGLIKSKQATIQREFLRRESTMYKDIYVEVTQMVGAAAEHYGYTMVIRFKAEDVAAQDDPQKLIQNMSQLVIYHQETDDITQRVIEVLNKRYRPVAGR
ncbi:OmpH family outer membrane protein [Stratiformator vulcanicus]|uniref:Outer membrane protein (OmpH-like) n=1 Tax=Stratiformator vulcanicus TaxID=2527980 RepID=A0A517R6F2_9PLAN|nr:OmpH family outer membrane protein [Stratiformator vulcanicus]QDT39451.1 Outer membrane protein (OmpH-like) [Stratiformator vulcanicus]